MDATSSIESSDWASGGTEIRATMKPCGLRNFARRCVYGKRRVASKLALGRGNKICTGRGETPIPAQWRSFHISPHIYWAHRVGNWPTHHFFNCVCSWRSTDNPRNDFRLFDSTQLRECYLRIAAKPYDLGNGSQTSHLRVRFCWTCVFMLSGGHGTCRIRIVALAKFERLSNAVVSVVNSELSHPPRLRPAAFGNAGTRR